MIFDFEASSTTLNFTHTVHCPFCSFELPNEFEKNLVVAIDHLVVVHKALKAEFPVSEKEPLELALDLGQPRAHAVRDAVVAISKHDAGILVVSVTRVEQSLAGPSLSSILYKIYGDPGVMTLATPSFKNVLTTSGLSPTVHLSDAIKDPYATFYCSYERTPEDFRTDENEKMAISLNIFCGHQPTSPLVRSPLRRQHGQFHLLEENPF